MDLSALDFGAPAAERDIAHGLIDYFVESQAFQNVATGKKSVILGNRGSGKSAIFKVLAQREKAAGRLVLELSPDDYSYEILTRSLAREAQGSWAKHGAFTAAWKYLIYVLVMKGLAKDGPRLRTGDAARIYEYLRDNHQDIADNPISLLVSYVKRIEGFKIGSYEASLKTRELDRLYKLEEIINLLPALNAVCSKRRVLVLVDELDRGWDASEDAKSFVAGLFQACIGINQNSPDVRVIVSLRRELYDSIPSLYEDAQKYRDMIETIGWDERTLLQLVANRIRHSITDLSVADDADAWNHVFAETLNYRQAKSFNYIVDRTLYRPREIIQFCSDAHAESQRVHQSPIDYQVISNAELVYSEGRTKDIAAEYRFQFPGLLSVFEVFRGRTYAFDRDELELLCLGICTAEYRTDEEAKWVLNQEPDFLIETLWSIGFLRAQAVGGIKALRRSGSSYLGPHQVANLNLRNTQRFHVHPMFRAYLAMKEGRERADDD
ncbi:MAG: hypothetical protein KF822_07595 [Steroidobacteraceae bacterium]|nr:hypothetical protein [Steroidobacteraceae bacterium]